MSTNNKMLLIFPPQWTPISPHYAVPTLLGQLEANGFEAKGLDLNIDFFSHILNKEFLEKSILKSKEEFDFLKFKLPQVIKPNKRYEDYSLAEQIEIYNYNQFKNIFDP